MFYLFIFLYSNFTSYITFIILSLLFTPSLILSLARFAFFLHSSFRLSTLPEPLILIIKFKIGINTEQYRAAIGSYNCKRCPVNKCVRSVGDGSSLCVRKSVSTSLDKVICMFVVVMVYLIPVSLSLTLQRKSSLSKVCSSPKVLFSPPTLALFLYIKNVLFFLSVRHKRCPKKLSTQGIFEVIAHYIYRVLNFLIPRTVLNLIPNLSNYNIINVNKCFKICRKLFTKFYPNQRVQLLSVTLILIIISNTSLLNPGPKIHGLTCFFQNIQGLITFSSLGKSLPEINKTKITEFQSHIYETSPDIIILNETWLKPSIKDEEILPSKMYKMFRLDRSVSD